MSYRSIEGATGDTGDMTNGGTASMLRIDLREELVR
jgi:hypothetical protein